MLQLSWYRNEDLSLFEPGFTQIFSEAQPPVDQLAQVYTYLNKLPRFLRQRVRSDAPVGGRFPTLQEVHSAALSVWSTEQLRDLHPPTNSDAGSDNSNGSKRRHFGNAGSSRMGGSAPDAGTSKQAVAVHSGGQKVHAITSVTGQNTGAMTPSTAYSHP